jgi:hypothetical protein
LLPPADFGSRELVTQVLTSNGPWYRLYQSRYPNPLGYGFGSSRFSDPEAALSPPDRFGIVFFGSSIKVCFAEAILRERAIGSKGSFPIGISELQEVCCASVEINQPLLLADLRSDGMLRMRIPTDAARAASHELGKQWSRALWLHHEKPDGIIYDSRLNGETNIALFDRALTKLTVKFAQPLLDFRDEMAQVLDDFSLEIV